MPLMSNVRHQNNIHAMPVQRCPKNVPGDFYTTGECLACGLPEHEAPECLAPLDDTNYETYFIRQPATSEEVERVCSAAEVCCVDAIRYCGADAAIRARLGPRYCDEQDEERREP